MATQHVVNQTYDFVQQADIKGAKTIGINIKQSEKKIAQFTVHMDKFVPNDDEPMYDAVIATSEMEFMTDEVKEFGETMEFFFLTIAYTGVRKGEAMGLQWKDINFENNTITIERTRDHYGVRPLKTKNSFRTIAVDEVVIKQSVSYTLWCKKYCLLMVKRYLMKPLCLSQIMVLPPLQVLFVL